MRDTEDVDEKRWKIEIDWADAHTDNGILLLQMSVCSMLFARFDLQEALKLPDHELSTSVAGCGGGLVRDLLTFCQRFMRNKTDFFKHFYRRAPGESPGKVCTLRHAPLLVRLSPCADLRCCRRQLGGKRVI